MQNACTGAKSEVKIKTRAKPAELKPDLRGTKMKYKLNRTRDVDTDEPEGPILNLPKGFRFSNEVVHTRGFDTLAELRTAAKSDVIPCVCEGCKA